MRKRFLTGIVLLAGLTACLPGGGGTGTEGENGVLSALTVNVVDSTGAPFGADTVYWSYLADGAALHKAAHGTDSTKKAAKRLHPAGTQWLVSGEGLHGAVFIRARYSRISAVTTSCVWNAYTQLEASAAVLPATVTLTMKPVEACM
jgi:hypothetical protein